MKVLENRLGKFGFTAVDVDVFDAQKRSAAPGFGGCPSDERREGVAEMKAPVRAWGEAKKRLF